jgi:hypothetical protein
MSKESKSKSVVNRLLSFGKKKDGDTPSSTKKLFSSKAKNFDNDKINEFADTKLNKEYIEQQVKSVSTIKVIIFLVIIVISVLISLQDILVDGAEAVADCATVGVAGIVGGPVELVDEIVSEMIQDILIALIAIPMSGGSTNSMIVRILIVAACSIIDIVVSIIALFIPCVADVAETVIEIGTEIIQNAVLMYSFYKMFY